MTDYTNTKGSFWIWEVRERQLNGVWPTAINQIDEYITNNYGWFGGGFPTTSTIDRLDFTAQTVSVSPAQLSAARQNLAATGST